MNRSVGPTHKEVTCPQFDCEHGARKRIIAEAPGESPMEVSSLHTQRKNDAQHYFTVEFRFKYNLDTDMEEANRSVHGK